MEIKLKSNRKHLFLIFGTLFALLTVGIIVLLIGSIVETFTRGDIAYIISFSIIDVISIFLLLFFGLRGKPVYIFNEEEIIYIKRNKQTVIKVADIESMTYLRPRWYDFFLVILVVLLGDTGGFIRRVIDVVEKNHITHELGYFGKKEVEKLAIMYGSLLSIK
ncbi:MAG: hypothetical protein K2M95_00010 [Clostridiales bacterium]|nr:hypothetical protein [Clostridiales bacterium]